MIYLSQERPSHRASFTPPLPPVDAEASGNAGLVEEQAAAPIQQPLSRSVGNKKVSPVGTGFVFVASEQVQGGTRDSNHEPVQNFNQTYLHDAGNIKGSPREGRFALVL